MPAPLGSLGYQPTLPQVAPLRPRSPLGFTPATAPMFTGQTPQAPTLPAFAAPDPANVANDPYYQFRVSEGTKGMQRSAAARGTLLTGGFQKALAGFNQGLASEEGQKAYDRALQTYVTNRDTAGQGFNQAMAGYQGSLAGFNANTAAAENTRNYNLMGSTAADDRARQAADEQRRYEQEVLDRDAAQANLQPTLAPTPEWAQPGYLPNGSRPPTIDELRGSPAQQAALAREGTLNGLSDVRANEARMRQEAADQFAREVQAAREANLQATLARPMGRNPYAVIRPARMA